MAVGFSGKVSELDVAGPAASGATERKGILKNTTLKARIGRTYTPPTHLSEPMKKTAKRLEFAWPVYFDPNHGLPQGEVYPRSKPKWQKFVAASDPRTNLDEGDPSKTVDVREELKRQTEHYEQRRGRPRLTALESDHKSMAKIREFVLRGVVAHKGKVLNGEEAHAKAMEEFSRK